MSETATETTITLHKRVSDDIKTAMKASVAADATPEAKDTAKQRVGFLRFVLAKAQDLTKKRPLEQQAVSEADMVAAVKGQITETKDKITLVTQNGGTADPKDVAYIAVLEEYLPTQMSNEELTTVITGILAETEDRKPSVKGFVNKLLKERHAGLYDAKRANEILAELLAAGK